MRSFSEQKVEKKTPKAPKLSTLYRFFCWCSGARLYILKQCPSEFNKYYGVGVVVFLTGIMASLSGGYAMHTVFRKMEISIAFGLLWGFIIFSIDWYIIASLRKKQSKIKEFGMILPRLILAILIAFVVSTPLKMKLFEREIDQQMLFDQQQSSIQYAEKVNLEFAEINRLEQENAMLMSQIQQKEEQRNRLFNLFVAEAEGRSATRTPGKGSVYREKKMEYDKVDAELITLRETNTSIIKGNNETLQTLRKHREESLSNAQVINRNADGFLARLQAMNSLTSSSKSIKYASLFIILLFITIESSPIIVKILAGRGPYDDLIEAEEYIKQVEIRRNVVQAELTEDYHIDLHRLLEKERNDSLYEVEKEHIKDEAQVISQINKLKISKWKAEEVAKINAKLGRFKDDKEGDNEQPVAAGKLFDPELSPELKDNPFFEHEVLDEKLDVVAEKADNSNQELS
ncbi:MAG: DUF4407 domain-containing protein [Bacteroidales bacterium]|nr:DUF4407 domain-containing protein [Bacteroidales bacterium]MDD4672317.1 DUF4407 domain-containing protein [Bacteroidales bacterium]MDY0349018.1 DUF4407 domain-containing protein [Tenuifilaceae bacterium]